MSKWLSGQWVLVKVKKIGPIALPIAIGRLAQLTLPMAIGTVGAS